MYIHILIGNGFIIKMKVISGIKYLEKQTIMDCTLRKLMGIEHTFCYFTKMLLDLEILTNGLLMLAMNKFPCPPTVLLGGLRLGPPNNPPPSASSHRVPPGTPIPPRRPTSEELHKNRRKALGRGYHSDDDENEGKENKPPKKEDEEVEEPIDTPVAQLLQKLEEAIDRLCDQVFQDLKDFKQKLGIH
uniref:E4 protein n=1 Tax=Human papillomavirus TaxID=10566 RepID=A0A451G3F6_9PAPI|nr:MAG: E4 protein [Human papillomavirus]